MKNARVFFVYAFISIHVCSCAQTKNLIEKTYATYTVHIPGNIPVDPNGNEIAIRDTLITVYVESATLGINWDVAWLNGKTYSVKSTEIDSDHYDIGMLVSNSQKFTIKTSGNDKLWKLQLIPGETNMPVPVKALHNQVIISGKYRGKKILQKINSMLEIEGMPTP